MDFRVLGPVEAVDQGQSVSLGSPLQRAVLVELLRARETIARERVIAALWADEPPKSAVGSLQVYVHGLRRALGGDRIETVGTAYRLRLEDGDRVDVDEFDHLVARARAALAADRPADAATTLGEALALWRGEPLADLAEIGEAAVFARELEDRRVDAIELRNDAWLAVGRHDLVLEEIDRLIAAQPYRERLRRQQIVALYRVGRQADALTAYRVTRDTWADELGIEPTPALRELERAVLRQDDELAGPAPRAEGQVRVPAPPTALVGRRLEIASVAALLRSQARLVTLLGPGGTGKTRLALAVADELGRELRDGAVFVDLAPVHDPALLLSTIAQALGLSDDASVADHLSGREQLIVLDNVEQIVEGAADVGALLAAAPRLRVLATSRTPLRLAAEHQYPVGPLPVPRADAPADEVAQSEAVQLFVARAHAAGRELPADAICKTVDGLPLALELAAAQTNLLSPAEILARFERDPALLASPARDVPQRQATLAATIEWSLGLLADEEREAFARLGVFVGGCTVGAAARIGVDLVALSSVVDKSLVQPRERDGNVRFAMLETVRPFAAELIGDDVRRLHAEWATELVEASEIEVVGRRGDTAKRLDELEAELDNLRAALEWMLRADEVELALRLMCASRPLWEIRGHLREASRWLDDVIAATGTRLPELRVKALGFAGTAAFRRGLVDEAESHWRQVLALYEELGDDEGIPRGLSDLGTAAAARGEWARSQELLEQAAARFRELGEAKRLAVCLGNLGHVAGKVGDIPGAIAATTEALELEREGGDEMRQAISLNNLGDFAAEAGDLAEARHWLDECFELADRIGYREVIAHALVTCARIALAEDDPAEAARMAAAADAVFAEAGVQMPGVEGENFAALKDEARSLLGDDAYARARAEAPSGRFAAPAPRR